MSNFKHKIAQAFMAEIGAGEGVEFDAERKCLMPWQTIRTKRRYKFVDGELQEKRDGKWDKSYDLMNYVQHMDDYTFIVHEFNPKEMQIYYFVTPYGNIASGSYYWRNTICAANKLIGNCFATREQAENNMGKIIQKFNSIKSIQESEE